RRLRRPARCRRVRLQGPGRGLYCMRANLFRAHRARGPRFFFQGRPPVTQRRTLLKAVAATSAAVMAPWMAAHAQGDFPAKTIKLLVPFGPGSTPDVFARLVSEHAAKTLGQSIVIEN